MFVDGVGLNNVNGNLCGLTNVGGFPRGEENVVSPFHCPPGIVFSKPEFMKNVNDGVVVSCGQADNPRCDGFVMLQWGNNR